MPGKLLMMTAAEFDRLLHAEGWEAARARCNPSDPEGRARAALAAIASRDPARVAAALAELGDEDGALTEGARLLCLTALENYAAVQSRLAVFAPADREDSSLEGTAYAMIAGAVADTEQGEQTERAVSRLQVAQVLTGLLGMTHRGQWAQIEGQRLRLPLGTACPLALEEAAALAPMSAGRQEWHREISAAALLGRGRYAQAAVTAPDGCGLQAFAATLRGQDDLGEPDGSFGSLALALQALRRGESIDELLCPVTAQPEQGYADLLRMAADLKAGREFADSPLPVAPDQRLLWGLLRWEAAHRDGWTPEAGAILAALNQARGVLPSIGEVVLLAQEFAPIAVAAFLASPLGADAQVDVPVLVGEHLRWRGQLHKLPGKRGGGQALVLHALGVPREVSRVERLRLRRAIRALGVESEPVNVADLLRALLLIADGARSPTWEDALKAVTDSVTGRAAAREIRVLYAGTAERDAEHA